MWLDLEDAPVPGHKFCGWHFKYPSEEGHLGLVSTIQEDPPMLNWIYVDKDTHAVKFGGRKDTIGHVIGPWYWTEDERFWTLQGDHTQFVARREDVESAEGRTTTRWGVYWDPEQALLEELEPDECQPVRLRRKPVMGIESQYVRD